MHLTTTELPPHQEKLPDSETNAEQCKDLDMEMKESKERLTLDNIF
jgi:hypothetical protein